MDEIDRLLRNIAEDPGLRGVRFTTGFLNDLADVYERHGLGVTRAYLLDKLGRRELQAQAEGALRVLDKFSLSARVASDRSIGRLILKSLSGVLGVRQRGGQR